MDQQFQDEQTGPRGGTLLIQALQDLKPGLPKRIVYSNGRHDSAGHVYHADEEAWLDCYVGGDRVGGCEALGTTAPEAATSFTSSQSSGTSLSTIPDSSAILVPGSKNTAGQLLPCGGASVVTYFGTVPATTGADNKIISNGTNPPLCSSAFPLPGTQWTTYFLNANGSMSTTQEAQGSRRYLSTGIGPDDYVGPTEETPIDEATTEAYTKDAGPVLGTQGPEELTWSLPFTSTTTLDGPIMADFWTSVAGVDTDFFVEMIDLDQATGAEQFLQYGLLRASYASGLNLDLSDCVNSACNGPDPGEMYRPYYDYTNPQLLTPGQLDEYRIGVFPLGWEFQPGHTLLVSISAPPGLDQLYAWSGEELPPTVNTVVSTAKNPSTILLPLLPSSDNPNEATVSGSCGQYSESSGAVEYGSQEGVRCVTPLAQGSSGLPDSSTHTADAQQSHGTQRTGSRRQAQSVSVGQAPTTLIGASATGMVTQMNMTATLTSKVTKAGISGQTVTFTLGSGEGTCSAVTNSIGLAGCSVNLRALQPVPTSYSASYAGSRDYLPSSAIGTVKR